MENDIENVCDFGRKVLNLTLLTVSNKSNRSANLTSRRPSSSIFTALLCSHVELE